MAQTDTRPGFRLPWTPDRNDAEQVVDEAASEPSPQETETPEMTEATSEVESPAAPAGRRPTKFMADLSRAMQVAAETARNETMARFEAESKTAIEEIHTASANEAAELRRRADDDLASIREWSKAEIASIREQTEGKINARKSGLDVEIDSHAATIEVRVERVTGAVAAYEAEMAEFFERMSSEDDPTRIATMAETMPEPPSLADIGAAAAYAPTVPHIAGPSVAPVEDERIAAWAAVGEPTATTDTTETTEPAAEALVADAPAETSETPETETGSDGVPFDYAAAEAEAAAFTGDIDEEAAPAAATPIGAGDLDGSSDAALNAPAAHVVPGTTRVVVLGLVSVASIATFKRSLGRTPGVAAVGVASGPDGEFVFTVSHDAGLDLAAAITSLPGFEARVNAQTAEGLEISAHDPDAA
jgi:hypothetical protein